MFNVLRCVPESAHTILRFNCVASTSELANQALALFWCEQCDEINLFKATVVQKRFDDPWYGALLDECRYGSLSDTPYNFIHGLPTEHTGSWQQHGTLACVNAECNQLPAEWRTLFAAGVPCETFKNMECEQCRSERQHRNRLLAEERRACAPGALRMRAFRPREQ